MVTLDKGKVGGGEAAAAFAVQEQQNGAAKNEGAAPAETNEAAVAFAVQEQPNGAAKNEGAAPAETNEAAVANAMSVRGWDGNVKAAAAPAELCVEKPAETDESAARREQIAASEDSFTRRQARDQGTFGNDSDGITKISQVPAEEVLFFRGLGFSNYYIIKIYDLVGEAAIALTQDNAFWLLEEFPRLGFAQADETARRLGMADDNPYRVQAAVEFVMHVYLNEGHVFAPMEELNQRVCALLELGSSIINDVLEDMVFEGRLQMAEVEGKRVVYFYGYYRAECAIAGKLAAMVNPREGLPQVCVNEEAMLRKAEGAEGIALSEQQKTAVRIALRSGVTIITGGPGTGKTTVIRTLLSILEGSGLKTAVAAPTGRAAKRVMETSGHYACTIHRLLEYYYDEATGGMSFGRSALQPLEYQAVIIDEASMMDLMLAEALCDALRQGTRLILVGDADQLPSVGAGNVLQDLIDSEYFDTIRLTEIYRQAEDSGIVQNAHRINRGEYPRFGDDFQLIRGDKQQEILFKIAALAGRCAREEVQVLTPTKKGILGSVNLNLKLQETFNPPQKDKPELNFGKRIFRMGDRVMQIKNDYRLEWRYHGVPKTSGGLPAPRGQKPTSGKGYDGKGIFNGEVGIVSGIDLDLRTVTITYDDDRWVVYQYVQLDEIEHAYAVTVHKSQGSEYPIVIIPMTWFPPVLATRSLIYTAITRGKRQVYIVGNPDYLNAMTDNNRSRGRNSGLCSRLVGLYGMV